MALRLRGFFGSLLAIAGAGGLVRVVHLLVVAPTTIGLGDEFWNTTVSGNIANGHGFWVISGGAGTFHAEPTAEHPPLYPVALAAARLAGVAGETGLRSLGVLFGILTIVGVGLLGRAIAGDAIGLVAAAITAVHPLFIAADGALLSETLYGPIVAFTLLAACRLAERPTARRAGLVGLGLGLATLTRSEASFLLLLLVMPLCWRRLRLFAVAAGCAVLVVSPWLVRNWITFDRPIFTNNQGDLIGNTNCLPTYHGRDLGFVALTCLRPASGDEAERSAQWRSDGVNYARKHAGRVPVVAAVRLLRLWTLYQPLRTTREQGRSVTVQKLGLALDFLLFPLAIGGAVALHRRRRQLVVLLAPIVLVSLVSMASYGSIRFRYAAEIPITVLAAAGFMRLFRARHFPLGKHVASRPA